MKSASSYVAVISFVLACIGWGLWIHDRSTHQDSVSSPSSVRVLQAQTSIPIPLDLTPPDVPTRDEWKEYFATRERVLRDNAEIAMESSELKTESEAQQQRLNAAIIQHDPRMAPLIAKLETMRRLSAQAQGEGVAPTQTAPNSNPNQ